MDRERDVWRAFKPVQPPLRSEMLTSAAEAALSDMIEGQELRVERCREELRDIRNVGPVTAVEILVAMGALLTGDLETGDVFGQDQRET